MTTAEIDEQAEVLTVEEAAAILRISRNAIYAADREWRVTGGKTGIPCIEIGRTLRVPRADLDRLLGRPPQLSTCRAVPGNSAFYVVTAPAPPKVTLS